MENNKQGMTRSEPTRVQVLRNLRLANEVAKQALQGGTHPFGSVLVGPDHETVLMVQGNVDVVNHAESVLARRAHETFTKQSLHKHNAGGVIDNSGFAELSGEDFLWRCTLYSTFEPCAMCAATQYWANIGRLVYACSEEQLLNLTGSSSKNPTMNVPSRYVFDHSQKKVSVFGPIANGGDEEQKLIEEILAVHRGFWDESAKVPQKSML